MPGQHGHGWIVYRPARQAVNSGRTGRARYCAVPSGLLHGGARWGGLLPVRRAPPGVWPGSSDTHRQTGAPRFARATCSPNRLHWAAGMKRRCGQGRSPVSTASTGPPLCRKSPEGRALISPCTAPWAATRRNTPGRRAGRCAGRIVALRRGWPRGERHPRTTGAARSARITQ